MTLPEGVIAFPLTAADITAKLNDIGNPAKLNPYMVLYWLHLGFEIDLSTGKILNAEQKPAPQPTPRQQAADFMNELTRRAAQTL